MAELDKKAAELGIDLTARIGDISFKNPIMTASGTFSARESGAFYDISELGAAVTKGVALEPWPGNDTPRIAETYGGMLNAVGLQNPGVEEYKKKELPYLKNYDTKIITNIAGHSIEEYCGAIEALNGCKEISMFEVNISCPNVSRGGAAFGTDPKLAAEVTKAVKKVSQKPVIIKLTPNVTDITEIAKAVEAEGADAVSLINTLLGMHIDLRRRKATLARKVGGFSGPAVKPVALRMVWQTAKAVKVPVVGLGGIASSEDVIEMMMAGASAVEIGAMNLKEPYICRDIINELPEVMDKYGIKDLRDIIGAAL